MGRYGVNFIAVVISILVGTSCERDEGEAKTSEEEIGNADAYIPEDSAHRDAKSPVDKKDADVIDIRVQDAGMGLDSATGDGSSIDQPDIGECSPDGLTNACYSGPSNTQGVGICKAGTQTCENGAWGECIGMVTSTEESCDGRDEDCDGETDEGLSLGACVPEGMASIDLSNECLSGHFTCINGTLVCEVVDTVQDEQCNGIDDDCDGETDEDTDTSCYTGDTGCTKNAEDAWECLGICEVGSQQCIDGALSGQCIDEVKPSNLGEQCNASPAVDDDCDGEVDEDCPCNAGDIQDCYTGPTDTAEVGTCQNGEQICYGGYWGFCWGEVTPVEETCENAGEDNDCDGDSDETPTSAYCYTGFSGRCAVGLTECRSNRTVCKPLRGPITEICNGIDDDCDGSIDEDFDLQNNEQRCGSCSNRCATGQQCCYGQCADLDTDDSNCGSCGTSCGSGESCVNGDCECNSGTLCGTQCVDTSTDPNNCGSCSNSCGANAKCINSNCQCDGGYVTCDDSCVDIQTDRNYCGDCWTECPDHSDCGGGVCHCNSGYTRCLDPDMQWRCYNLNNDRYHCGNCETNCEGGGFASCIDGECQ